MPSFRTLDDAGDLAGKRVLLRVDLNVPMKDGVVTDATRIERVAGSIRELSEAGAKVAILAHFDRPKGKRVAGDVARAGCPRRRRRDGRSRCASSRIASASMSKRPWRRSATGR